jgi:hypothetical protein
VSKIDSATWQTDVPYCDYYGRIWNYLFDLYTEAPFNKAQANTPIQQLEPSESKAVFGNARDYYLLRKDSREILTFNYEVEFVTNRPDLIIGSAMASNNPLVSGIGAKNVDSVSVYFLNREINKFESKIEDFTDVVARQDITVNSDNLTFTIPNVNFKSWVIFTPFETLAPKQYQNEDGQIITISETKGGDVLLASNKSNLDYENNSTETIYFTGKSNIYE